MMFSHDAIWRAIDALAERHRLSPSGLARRAGLDPTTFNKSKRQSVDGRERWPSTESIAKVLYATGSSIEQFLELLRPEPVRSGLRTAISRRSRAPFRCSALRRPGRRFLRRWRLSGRPGLGHGGVSHRAGRTGGVYALEIQGDSMMPLTATATC